MTTALGKADRQLMAEVRTLARADRREELIDALALMDSPTLTIHADELHRIGLDILHAAAFGTLSGAVEQLCAVIERLDGQLAQAAEMLAEDSTREADYYLATAHGLAVVKAQAEASASKPPARAEGGPRCAICQRDAHRPGSGFGNHGHAYAAPEDLAPSNPVPSRSVWRVDENTAEARELAQYPGPQADRQARELNGHAATRPHVHYMSLPPGAAPFDYETEADRRNALAEDPDPMGLDGYRDTARDSRS